MDNKSQNMIKPVTQDDVIASKAKYGDDSPQYNQNVTNLRKDTEKRRVINKLNSVVADTKHVDGSSSKQTKDIETLRNGYMRKNPMNVPIKEKFYDKLQQLREEQEQLDELKGYRSKKGQKLLQKVQKRAVNRMIYAADKGDVNTARKNQSVSQNAWDRFEIKEEEQLDETQDSLAGGLRKTDRPDLGLSNAPLNKKGKLSGNTKKWMKRFAKGSGTLYSRSLGKPKGMLPESEQLDELREPKNSKQRRKEVAAASAEAETDKIIRKHDEASGHRLKFIRTKDKKHADAAKESESEMSKAGTRGRKLRKIAKLDEANEEEARQKRLAKWVRKEPKPKKKGKNAELMAGWADEIRQVRASMQARKKKQLDEVSKELAMRASRKAEKAGFEADSLADRMSNAANTFGKTRAQQDDLDKKSAEARKKSNKKFKQKVKFRKYADKK